MTHHKLFVRFLKTAVVVLGLLTLVVLSACRSASPVIPTPILPAHVPSPEVVATVVATEVPLTAVPVPTQEIVATTLPAILRSELSPLAFQTRNEFSAGSEIVDLALIDLTGGGTLDIVASTQDKQVHAFGLDGMSFSVDYPAVISIVAGGDMDNDIVGDIFLGGEDQTLTVAEADVIHELFIQRDNIQPISGRITAVTTLPINEQPTLFVGTTNGNIIAFGLDLSSQQWITPPAVAVTQLLSLPDTTLIAGYSDGRIVALTDADTVSWTHDLAHAITAMTVVPETVGSDSFLVAGDSTGQVLGLDKQGNEQWLWSADEVIHSLVAIEDVGRDDLSIVVGSGEITGKISGLDGNGRSLWQTVTGYPPQAITTADLDGDGRLDIIVGTGSGDLLVFDTMGALRGRTTLPDAIKHLAVIHSGDLQTTLLVSAGESIYQLETTTTSNIAELPALPDPTQVTAIPTNQPTAVPATIISSLPTLPDYDIQVNLDYYGHTANITQSVTIPNNSTDNWDEIVFHAAPAYWPGHFDLQTVSTVYAGSQITLTPTITSTMIHLPLPEPLLAGETGQIELVYELTLPQLDPLGWGPIGNAGWGPDLIQMGDWYSSLVPYDEATHEWHSWQYTPVGDPVRNDLANFSVQITTAPDVTIAAPGYINTIDNTRNYQLKNGRAFAFLVSPNYVYLEGSSQGKPVRVYVLKEHQSLAPVVLETAVQALALFQNRFGTYPHTELIIAENGFVTAMEYSSIISLSGFAFDEYDNTPQTLLTPITAHEVAHQYFYSAVGNDQVLEPWLDESLAMLAEFIYYETYHPEYEEWWWQYRVNRWNPTGYVDATIYDYSNSPDFVHDMYSQSAYFMYELREEMGVVNFDHFIRAYYQQHLNQIATTNDFFDLAQDYTNVDLSPLVTKYFENLPTALSSQQ